MTPKGKKRLEYAIYALIGLVLIALPFVRCLVLRHADGRAASSRIVVRDGAVRVLVLIDEVCTGGDDAPADCDTRAMEVEVPSGKKLRTVVAGGWPSKDVPTCPYQLDVGGDWLGIDSGGGATVVSRAAEYRAVEGRWSRRIPGDCMLAEIVEGVLVVATTSASHRAVGIDLETGAVRWRIRP